MLEQFRAKKYRSVGVLKFHIMKTPDSPLTHTAGTLNYNAARRLEAALVLASIREGGKTKQPVMIVRDASKTAAAIPRADHLGVYGRSVLFAPIYLPSWGEAKPLFPDAFVSGALILDASNAAMTVHLHVFDKTNSKEVRPLLDPFVVDIGTDTLVETGHTFRSLNLKTLEQPNIPQPANVPQAPTVAVPAANVAVQFTDVLKDAPVELQILYDGERIEIKDFVNGEYRIPAPQPNQRVEMRLLRRDNTTDARYGVVLMVNGVSTLNMERKPPMQCQRWVFERNAPPGTIAGYYKLGEALTEVAEFRVVPPNKELRTEYKDNLGTISFTILKEKLAPPQDETVPLKEQFAAAEITRRVAQAADLRTALSDEEGEEHPEDLPRSLQAVRDRLVDGASEPVRNAIIPGAAAAIGALQTVAFQNPGVVMSVTIRYMRPVE
jgi:hypothetical protein